MKTIHSVSSLAGLLLAVTLPSAYGNGRSSPGPSETLVKAVCEQRSDGARHEIFRARLVDNNGPAGTLKIRAGGASEQVAMAGIKSVVIARSGRQADGFAKATLVRNDRAKEEVLVQVGTAKSPLRLAGFSAEGTRVDIDLAKCGTVDFSALKSGPEPRDTSKK